MNENSPNQIQQTMQNRRPWTGKIWSVAGYWFQLIAQPVLAITLVIALAWLIGFAQRNLGWFQDAETSVAETNGEEDALYACSMLCVFVKAPGRCPVCGMKLQQIEVPGDPKDIYGVTIDPAARRLANIQSVAALNLPLSQEIEVLGKIVSDETRQSTIAAYVDGRIEEMYVDFTGANVKQGQPLAVLYSPSLYADQIGLLGARKLLDVSDRDDTANQRLYESARRRLLEFGLSADQIREIEQRGKPNTRIQIEAPISGTCVEKRVSAGDYVEAGMPMLKLADLSNVWLMLEMFPEDTRNLKIGQSVTVTMVSQPGQSFAGRVSFIDPMVEPTTNTVNVRVEIPNEAGLIKIGDFGKAKIRLDQNPGQEMVVVPREAVLVNGTDSIAYVETEPGRFEFRRVEIAEFMGDKISLSAGIQPGELVVASGVFMLDSTFNIQGKVSLIDPHRAARQIEATKSKSDLDSEADEIEQSLAKLSAEDRQLADAQVICPVTEVRLGSAGMGTPIRVEVDGISVMICCERCRAAITRNPEKYLRILEDYATAEKDATSGESGMEPQPSTPMPTGNNPSDQESPQ